MELDEAVPHYDEETLWTATGVQEEPEEGMEYPFVNDTIVQAKRDFLGVIYSCRGNIYIYI